MGILLDTSLLIAHERGRIDVDAQAALRPDEPFYLSAITASELLHGVHRATDPAIRTRRAAFVERLLMEIPILPIDLAAARAHARIWADLAAQGQLIGPHDLWLAATAIAHDLAVATFNVREFERVGGLRIDTWS